MKDGYYWARYKAVFDEGEWEIVLALQGWVGRAFNDRLYKVEDFEFVSERIERPMTDDEIEAMES